MNKSNIYKQVDECLLENMDGELLLYHPSTATTLHLNGPSAIVWELSNGENSVQAIIETVQQAYPDQAEEIATDIINVTQDLFEHEVLELVSP